MMLVKDLMHLLQTRAKPDDEVCFMGMVGLRMIKMHTMDHGFDSVWREDEECYIAVGKEFMDTVRNHHEAARTYKDSKHGQRSSN